MIYKGDILVLSTVFNIITSKQSQIKMCVQAFLGLLSNATLFPNKLMLQIASYTFFLKRNKTKQNDYKKKGKSLTWQESNPRPQMCEGNTLSIAPGNHCKDCISNKLYLTFLCPQDKLFKMVQKMQT